MPAFRWAADNARTGTTPLEGRMAKSMTPHGAQNTMGGLFAPTFHRPWFRYVDSVDGAGGGSEDDADKADDKTDWKAEARKHESRSKEWQAKAKANETAAQRLKELEDADKSEAEKALARAEAAEKRAAEAEAKALRAEIATEKGVPVALLAGNTREELEASAAELIKFKGDKPEPEKQDKKSYFIPDEGGKPDLGKTETTRAGIGTLRAAYEQSQEGK